MPSVPAHLTVKALSMSVNDFSIHSLILNKIQSDKVSDINVVSGGAHAAITRFGNFLLTHSVALCNAR